ncbi:metallophosphoesterase family protein [Pseudaestuariivita sp.]|uniref:metallophosphoesterase family protein n=1 Tax=Pseudaestuariivita sp. TaxID=2211669 RepID=UPI004059B842
MRVKELAELDGKVLLYGGAYSNLAATEALFALAEDTGIAVDHRVCTGDLVAYCARAEATVQLVRGKGGTVLAGNCERQLAAGAADCGCGFEAGTTCDRLSAQWYAHALRDVSHESRAWMAGLPDVLTFTHQALRCAALHGGVTDIARFVWRTSPEAVFAEELSALRQIIGPVDMVIAGHSGLPFARQIGETLWVNTGALGMPPNDGTPYTSYAILDGTPTLHRLTYDPAPEVQAMEAAGLTQGYHAALTTEFWPSEDVLPPELRRAQALPASG